MVTGGLARVTGRVRRGGAGGFPWAAPQWPEGVEREAPERKLGVDYETEWSRRYAARLVRAMVLDNVTRPLAHAVASPQVRGSEMLELVEAPAIFVANHASHVDFGLLLAVLPRRFRHKTVVAAAADYFFDRRWKAHLSALGLGAVPIERHKVNRRSADTTARLLEEGWNLVIFPEGGRSPDGWFQEFRGGAAYLARRTGRPVVPVHIDGTWRILPKDGNRLRRNQTRITFGTPMSPAEGEDTRRFGTRIETTLATMADEGRTDWWTARRRAAAGTTPSPRGPRAGAWRRAWALGAHPRDTEDVDEGRWAVSGD
ncbi:MAG TPA: lysophospholipid acyltransferase family protein [Acidimicrobiales bacterium]|nr:lysophospholipid acyltransferase family protein [Acidimicrobiales bacterium]